MVKKKKLLNGTQSCVQDIEPTERSVDQRKGGKMTSTISSNKFMKKKNKMNQSKERLKTTTIGSTLQKIGSKMTEKEKKKTRTLNKAAAVQRS